MYNKNLDKMNKELLRMQMLAGIITESQYKQLLEDQGVIDRILDKISSQGIGSLEPEEKEYLDKHSKGEKDLMEPISGKTKVYTSVPYVELYKIENFPSIPSNIKLIDFDCEDAEHPETCENYEEMQELLKKSPKLKSILDKIRINAFGEHNLYFHRIDFEGGTIPSDFTSPLKIAYAQVSGDGTLYFVDSLTQFNQSSPFSKNNYQTEEGWGVKSWKEI
jgi:hypothetical protein